MKRMIYSGIGSRETPKDILELMSEISKKLDCMGYTLRSGGAVGADRAFEYGVSSVRKEIFRPKHATLESIELISKCHPKWEKCDESARLLHGRNAIIIMGKDLKTPSDFVIAWTPNGALVGGTSTGIRLAIKNEIPVFNLSFTKNRERLLKFVNI